LTHDLGKGTTPKHRLPGHSGHETRGLVLIRQLADRLRVPRACRDLALVVSEFHTHCHRALELRAKTLLKLLERSDAFRRPDRFEQFLLTCEADARGRKGLEERAYPQADYLRGAFSAAAAVDAGAIAKDHAKHKIAKAIHRARLAALRDYRRSATAVEINEH